MMKRRIIALVVILLAVGIGFFNYYSQFKPASAVGQFPFRLGLDLNGGSLLTYQADVSKVAPEDVSGAMQSLRDVIDNRVNAFGVAEPVVQVEESNVVGSGKIEKLVVELPGVTDISQAVATIGATPLLEFRLVDQTKANLITPTSTQAQIDQAFVPTGLTGQYLQNAQLEFDPQTGAPLVTLNFNSQGKAIFASTTKNNIGSVLAIFLDGQPISTPVIRQEIDNGVAQISGGSITADAAKTLVRNLNYGALPVPITLVGTQTIGASLGSDALHRGIEAGLWGFAVIALFLILWYRLPGVLAVVSLSIYVMIMLALFKLIPVTLSSAGLAGLILSIGMAVDANILIFERMREEFKKGFTIEAGIREGFHRAWLSIRDSNISSLITGAILYFFGSTSTIKGFALVFVIGVLVSMLTAITVSRTFLLAVAPKKNEGFMKFLFNNGIGH